MTSIKRLSFIFAATLLLAGFAQAAAIPGSAGVATLQDGPNAEGIFFQVDVHYEAFDGLDATDPLGVTPGKIQFAYILEYVNGNAYMRFFDFESTNGVPLLETASSANGTVDGLTPGAIAPGLSLIWTAASGNPVARFGFLNEDEDPTFGLVGDRSTILAFTVSNEYSVGSILATGTDHSLSDGGEVTGPAEQQECLGSVEGSVFCNNCSATGQIVPVADMTVKAIDSNGNPVASTTTGANGRYTISGLKVGDYTIVVDKGTGNASCSADSVAVTVTCEAPATASFCVCPQACTQQICVSVVCDQNNSPIPGAWVGLIGPNSCPIWTRTAADGMKCFSGAKIVPGHYRIIVKAPRGYEMSSESSVEFDLAACESKQVVFNACPVPPCSQSICVSVVQPGDNNSVLPIPGVNVKIRHCNTVKKEGLTAADGSKCFDNLKLGHYTVTVDIPEGYRLADGDKTVQFVLHRCDQKSVQFVLAPVVLGPCPQLPCYWKIHPDRWPIVTMYIGADLLNQQQLMNLLNGKLPDGGKPKCNDITVDLAQYLIAVKLSIAAGSDPQDIEPVIIATDEFLLYDYPPGSSPTGRGKQLARELKNKLYDYLIDRKYCQDSN